MKPYSKLVSSLDVAFYSLFIVPYCQREIHNGYEIENTDG